MASSPAEDLALGQLRKVLAIAGAPLAFEQPGQACATAEPATAVVQGGIDGGPTIDLVSGKDTYLGIYELKGDTLRLCFASA